jgi:hypothetical protein
MKKASKKPPVTLWKRIKASVRAGNGSVVLQNDHSPVSRS